MTAPGGLERVGAGMGIVIKRVAVLIDERGREVVAGGARATRCHDFAHALATHGVLGVDALPVLLKLTRRRSAVRLIGLEQHLQLDVVVLLALPEQFQRNLWWWLSQRLERRRPFRPQLLPRRPRPAR